MLDCGLRVTEACSLKIKNLIIDENLIRVKTLKRKNHTRDIPLTKRVLFALAEYYKSLKDKSPDAYLFPTNSKAGHIHRKRVYRVIKSKSGSIIHPHALRHTFATKIANNGTDIRVARDLLGHSSITTTEIYCHTNEQLMREAINKIDKLPFRDRVKQFFKPTKTNVFVLDPFHDTQDKFVGRGDELSKINDNYSKKINTLITGVQGIGKSAILRSFEGENIIRLDDFKQVKQTLGNLLLTISDRSKEEVIALITDHADLNKIITKESTSRIIELIIKSTEVNEFTLVIDDLTDVTKTGVRVLEKLKNHFHIIAAARKVKLDYMTMITNFHKIEIKPLKRHESLELIRHLSQPFQRRIDDYEAFKNHVCDSCNGNPMAINELINRFRKEPDITMTLMRDIRHMTALREYDMSLIVIIGLSSLMVLRYIGGEFSDDSGAFRLFGGVFLVFALFARNILNMGKRKFV